MAIAYAQEAHDYSFPPAVTTFSTASITPGTGNVLVAWVESYNFVTMLISDTLGGLLWTRIGTSFATGGGNYLDVWVASVPLGGSPGVVMFSVSGSPFAYPACQVMEFSGVDTTTPIHAQAQGTGNNTAPQKSVVCTIADTLLVGVCGVAGGATLSGTVGWTQPNGGYGGVYGPVEVSSGTYTPTFLMTSGAWAVNAFALKPVAAPSPSTGFPSIQTFWMG
jgi:hypothetical protein